MNLTQLWEAVEERRAWRALVHGVTVGHDLMTKQQYRSRPLDLLSGVHEEYRAKPLESPRFAAPIVNGH